MPWAVSRCLGFHRARCGGTSLRSLGTQEPLPCGGCAAGGSTERSVGWDTCQWECSAGRKLLRLSLSCLIAVSRTRLFWKHTVEKCPRREEGKEGERVGAGAQGEGSSYTPEPWGPHLIFPFCCFWGLIRHQLNPAVAGSAPSQSQGRN